MLFVFLYLTFAEFSNFGNSPSYEFLSDHLERIVSFSQGWGELGLGVSAHAPYQTPLPLQIKDKRYKRGWDTTPTERLS
jgi:hypothetical protein